MIRTIKSIKSTALLAVAGLLLTGVHACAQSRTYEPPVGGAERKAIMDALRKPVETSLNRPVLFQVPPRGDFRAQDGWVFLTALLRKPNGSPMDFRGTRFAGQPYLSDTVDALLHRTGGRWHVVTFYLCASDVEWRNWARKYHAPRAIFPKDQDN